MKKITIQYFCDVCGKELQKDSPISRLSIHRYDLEADDYIGENPYEGSDFCPECTNRIREFISSMADKTEEVAPDQTPAEPEEDVSAEESLWKRFQGASNQKKSGFREKLSDDIIDEIRMMVAAGASQYHIGESLGISAGSVNKYVRLIKKGEI